MTRRRGPDPRLAGLLLALAALCASAGELRAQRAPPVHPGARVRVTAFGFERRVGSVVEVRGDTLVFHARDEPDPVALAILGVRRLEVPRGRHSPLRGALIGTGLGALAGYGAAAALVAGEECGTSDCITGRSIAAFFVWVGATAAGGIGGALVAADTERWVALPLASLAPAGAVTLPAGVPAGVLVRVSAQGAARPVVARVVGVRGDSLVLATAGSGGETAVALAEVRALEIGAGRTRTASALRGAGIGAGVGAVVVGALAYAAGRQDEWAVEHGTVGRNTLWMAGLFGAPLGAGVGGLAGYAVGTERWVLLPPLAGVSVAPGRDGGVAVGLTLPAR